MDIAIEGATVSIGLDVPAADIVGFEHTAKTTAEMAAMDAAKARLAQPLELFAVPNAAGCTVKSATVKIEGGEKDQSHTDFNAGYTLACTSVAELKSIDFKYFDVFKGAEDLEVNLTSASGQAKFEVSRRKPRLDLPASK